MSPSVQWTVLLIITIIVHFQTYSNEYDCHDVHCNHWIYYFCGRGGEGGGGGSASGDHWGSLKRLKVRIPQTVTMQQNVNVPSTPPPKSIPKSWVPSREAMDTIFKVFGLSLQFTSLTADTLPLGHWAWAWLQHVKFRFTYSHEHRQGSVFCFIWSKVAFSWTFLWTYLHFNLKSYNCSCFRVLVCFLLLFFLKCNNLAPYFQGVVVCIMLSAVDR